MTKSQQVRSIIATAKTNKQDLGSVILVVMKLIGFDRQLARVYVKNNWDKVFVEVNKPTRVLSMTPNAIRKRAARARARSQTQAIA